MRADTFNKYFNRSEDEPDQLRITSGLGNNSRIEFEGAAVHTQHLPFNFLMFLRSIPACLARSRNALKFHNKLIQRQAAPRPAHKYFARPPRSISLSSSTTATFFQPHQYQPLSSTKILYHQNNSISSSKWLAPSRQLVSTYSNTTALVASLCSSGRDAGRATIVRFLSRLQHISTLPQPILTHFGR